MKITVIATGGTIGSRFDETGIRTRSQEEHVINQILAHKPRGYPSFDINITYPYTLLSENMVPADWVRLCEIIVAEIKKGCDAIVVSHGTDTMAYSLAAASFMLDEIPVPIVFTGALLPYGAEDCDGHQNLWDSIVFAGKHEWAGVFLVFQSPGAKARSVYWGPRVQSIKAGGKYFETVDNKPIAKISKGRITQSRDPFKIPKKKNHKPEIDIRIDERIEVYKVYPGFNPNLLRSVTDRGVKAILIDLYHSGTACARTGSYNKYSIIPAITKLKEKGVAVIGAGASSRPSDQYKSTSALVKAGLHPLGRMSLEASVVKAMCLLGRGVRAENLCKEMDKSIMMEIAWGG